VHEAGRRSHQVIKTAGNSQDLPNLMVPYDIPIRSKDMHICYMQPSAMRGAGLRKYKHQLDTTMWVLH